MNATVAVVFGGPSPEHDVSVLTGLQAARALSSSGQPVAALYWSRSADWFEVDPTLEAEEFVEGAPKGAVPARLSAGAGFTVTGRMGRERSMDLEVAVNCCHGGPGEDGTLQAALDLAGLAYTGPSVASAAVGMDKLAFAAVAREAGLPSLPRAVVSPQPGSEPVFAGPYIVKPRYGGSSIGIEIVEDYATAQHLLSSSVHLRRGALVEPFRESADDLEIAIRTFPGVELSAISKAVRSGGRTGIYGYGDKYVGGEGMVSAPRDLPAALPDDVAAGVRSAATTVAALAEVRGVARLDFLLHDGELLVNEINTIPGSLAKYLWIDPPIDFATLLNDMVTEARQRPTHHYSSAGADGTALRSAGSIAAKLG